MQSRIEYFRRLLTEGIISSMFTQIQTILIHSLEITPAKLVSTKNYDREKYLEMLLDSVEAGLAVFGFNRSLFGFDNKKTQ